MRSVRQGAVHDDHCFKVVNPPEAYGASALPIGMLGWIVIHYWARSFRDCLLKTLLTRMVDAKAVDQPIARGLLESDELPVRLRLLAFLDCQTRYITLPSPSKAELINLELEEHLLRTCLTADQELRAWDLFRRYRDALMLQRLRFPPYPAVDLLSIASVLPPAKDLLG